MNDETQQGEKPDTTVANPFGTPSAERGAGAMIQSDRAQSEIQAAVTVAQARPRDRIRAMDMIIQDFTRPSLAEIALYAYPKGGETVTGPSIRAAESIVQRWGNMRTGVIELQQDRDKTVAMAYAWDLETNNHDERTFTVPHIRHTRKGSYKLEDPREIYELIANQGARRKRAAIQMVVPQEVFNAAVGQAEKTLAQTASVDEDSIAKMIAAFAEYGVAQDQLVRYIGHRLDSMITAEMVRLKKVYASIRDGFAAPADFFGTPEPPEGGDGGEAPASGADRFRDAVSKKKAAAKKKASSKKKATAARESAQEPSSPEGGGSQGSGEDDQEPPAGATQAGDDGFGLAPPGEQAPAGGGPSDAEIVQRIQRTLPAARSNGDLDTIADLESEASEIANEDWREHCRSELQAAREAVETGAT